MSIWFDMEFVVVMLDNVCIELERDVETHTTYVIVHDVNDVVGLYSMPLFVWEKLKSDYNLSFDVDDIMAEIKRCHDACVFDISHRHETCLPDYMRV